VSTAQLIVTLAFVGLLGAFHVVLRTARASMGTAAVTASRPSLRRGPTTMLLVLGGVAALAFAAAAFVISTVGDDEDDASAPTQPTVTTTPPTTMPPAPPEPPPPALDAPAGTALVARVVTNARAAVTTTRNRVGDRLRVVKRERGVYAVSVPGLSAEQRQEAQIRARRAKGSPRAAVSARKMGPQAQFVVFTRNSETGEFSDSGFEFAVFLPKEDLEATAAEDDGGRPELPGTR
jgi:hypothetical protein